MENWETFFRIYAERVNGRCSSSDHRFQEITDYESARGREKSRRVAGEKSRKRGGNNTEHLPSG